MRSNNKAKEKMGNNINTKREAWIDAVRIFAMLSVVFGHSIGASGVVGRDGLVLWMVAWNMPLFIMLSGYTLVNRLKKTDTLKSVGLSAIQLGKRMIVPAVVIGNIMNCVGCVGKKEWLMLGLLLLSIIVILFLYKKYRQSNQELYINIATIISVGLELTRTHFWFLAMLFLSMVILISIQWLTKRLEWSNTARNFIFISLIVIGGGYLDKYEMGDMALYLLFGVMIVELNKKGIDILKNQWLLFVLPIIGSALSLYIGNLIYFYDYPEKVLFHNGQWYIYLLRLCCGACWSIWFMALMIRIVKRYNTICYWGTLTIGIYLTHGYFLRYIRSIYSKYVDYDAMNALSGIAIGVLPAFVLAAISIGCCYLFKRYRTTRELLLGEYQK